MEEKSTAQEIERGIQTMKLCESSLQLDHWKVFFEDVNNEDKSCVDLRLLATRMQHKSDIISTVLSRRDGESSQLASDELVELWKVLLFFFNHLSLPNNY